MRSTMLMLLATLVTSPATAQKYTGTFRGQAQDGSAMTLVLTQGEGGRVTGTYSGAGATAPLTGQVRGGVLTGEVVIGGGRWGFEGGLTGEQLQLIAAPLGPDGTPVLAQATMVSFTRTSTTAQAVPAPAPQAAPPGASAPPAGAAAGGGTQDRQLTQLLLSSAWCSFSYSQTSGATNTSRSVFLPDGRLQTGTNYEGGTVNQQGGGNVNLGGGTTGSVYSQSQGGGTARWKVQGGQLYLDGGEGFQLVPLQISRNSNGYPIITADGKEYSQCR